MNKELFYLHGFNLLPQFGPSRLGKICKNFQNLKDAYTATEKSLIAAGIEAEHALIFIKHRESLNLEKEAAGLENEGIKLLSYKDALYPKLLLEIPKLPPLLYYRGKMVDAQELCVAAVGTRKISTYGRTAVQDIITPLVETGVTIVSGMAYGVDSEVHKIATKNHKRTIAILGGGLDDRSLYPKHHQLLAHEILENGGALISEYPPGTPCLKHHFVSRNRIISGMSVATIIIECGLKSGSLITARHALDQNRQIFAVPGPIYSENSQGPNNLIKMGAKPVTEANDVLEELNLKTLPQQEKAKDLFGDTPEENTLLQILTKEPIHINNLIKQSGLSAADVTSTLTFLEMKGKVRNLGGQQYILSR